jgi:hypothetical protein
VAGPVHLRIAWLALLLAASGRAAAQTSVPADPRPSGEPSLEVVWNGPEDCARGDAVRLKVLRLLGRSQRELTPLRVSVTVHHDKGARWVAELETSSSAGGGTKRLEGESCDAIALASSVVIALSLDPEASLDTDSEPPAPPPAKPKPTPAAPLRAKPPESPRETFGYVYGSGGVLFRLLKQPSVFTHAALGIRHWRLSVEVGGSLYQQRSVALRDRPKTGAELKLVSGELLGCFALVPHRFATLEVCPGAELEFVSARAFGVSDPDYGSVVLGAGLGLGRARLRPTSWLSATFEAGAAARPFHPKFVLQGVGDVFEIPVVSSFVRTGLAVEF